MFEELRKLFYCIKLILRVIAMRNNNYLSLINFDVKTSPSEAFLKNEHNFVFNFFWDVVNIVSRGMLGLHIGCYNHVV